jgi:uncharacterized membrane-anchored protein
VKFVVKGKFNYFYSATAIYTRTVSSKQSQTHSRMKKVIKISFSVIVFIIAMMLTVMSSPPYEDKVFLFSFILIVFGGLVISLTFTTWTNKKRKTTFLNSLEISFGLSSFVFILGYLYTALQPIILK